MTSGEAGPSPDAIAAHQLLTELRTRISTQPLPYQYGVEARALESLWEVFAHARAAIKDNPGCAKFASSATELLNVHLRPMTAKWHRAHRDGRLNSRDGTNEFRADLRAVQERLNEFADALHLMAYCVPRKDLSAPPPIDEARLGRLMGELPFGIQGDELVPVEVARAINCIEREAVMYRRKAHQVGKDQPVDAVGLALSGGGIRSASFCLGVVQVLSARGLLKEVDYLSTVSGGGYVGSFLTRRLDDPSGQAAVASPHGPDAAAVRYLRQHAKYLSVDLPAERWKMAVAGLAGLALNWTAPLFVACLAALAMVRLGDAATGVPWASAFAAACALVAVCLPLHALRLRLTGRAGAILPVAAAILIATGAAWAVSAAVSLVRDSPDGLWLGFACVAGVVAASPMLLRFLPVMRSPASRKTALRVVLAMAGLLVPLGAALATYWLWRLGTLPAVDGAPLWSPGRYGGWTILLGLTGALGLTSLFLLDVNLTGPHRLYRDRLARTFVQTRADEEDVPMADVNHLGLAPYHIINAAVDLPSSANPRIRERRSDFFVFSKGWCGAPSVGYRQTSEWRAGRAPIDLATAMAISGAAISPHMGLGSEPSLSALLSLLNVRLNYWIRHPCAPRTVSAPGFSCLLREMTGLGMSETARWLSLSDGGHIENMGVYELLRRRCKFIVSVDGEADPRSTFQGHLTLVRHAQIDFGIRIDPDLSDLRPDATSKLSQSHVMMARVTYPAKNGEPSGIGLILYMKLSVTGNEIEAIKRYRLLNPDFPHQSTLDQFFDEEQFEAYRQLGVHVVEGLFSGAFFEAKKPPRSMYDWFAGLATHLLLPSCETAETEPAPRPEDGHDEAECRP